MLAAAVDACERLFVQQTVQPVADGDALHRFHDQLVLVGGDVRAREHGREFVLAGSDFVVLGLCEDAQLPQLLVQVLHIGGNARFDGAEVMIFQLLPLRGFCAEQRSARKYEILARVVHLAVDEEIFLLRPDGGNDALRRRIAEQAQYAQSLLVERRHAL